MKRPLEPKEEILKIFEAALAAADPCAALLSHLSLQGSLLKAGPYEYELNKYDRIIVVGAGKGTAPMAVAANRLLGSRITEGLVIVKYGHKAPDAECGCILQAEASHPLPDEAGLEAARSVVRLVEGAGEKDLVVCLLSGGASALLSAPAEGITLDELILATKLLVSSGADIGEVNSVRKHISLVKGGRLAELAAPAELLTLIVSDVIGDRLDTIASGPTVPDGTTYADALSVIDRYGLAESMPASVIGRLRRGAEGALPETPKGTESCFASTRNLIVAGLAASIDAARKKAETLGFATEVITTELKGDVETAARMLAARALEVSSVAGPHDTPACLISGGETTVKVTGSGLGGRNQHLALVFASLISGQSGITMLSAGTDGTDGPTDAAGAMVDGETIETARAVSLDHDEYIENNDSYNFFASLDERSSMASHIKTGPTGTNVNDIQIIVVGG